MTIEARIGIVGGKGWLGNAIAQAAVATGSVDPVRLTLSGRSDRSGATVIPGARWTRDNQELVDRSNVVVLSVRPDQFPDVQIVASGKLVISVMAGVPARVIEERTGAEEVVRAIPNAAAAIRRSFTPWYATPPVSAASKQVVQRSSRPAARPQRCPLKPMSTIASG
jgi:pyrroline-5-carboxylate reductase